MARKFGEIKRSAKKARRHLFRVTKTPAWEAANIFLGAKKGAVYFEVTRTYEKGGAYKARACMISRAQWTSRYRGNGPSRAAYKRHNPTDGARCAIAQGPSPTRAVKRAVASLMKKIK
jgi:hypothetical protein